jgi:hypothetical protein
MLTSYLRAFWGWKGLSACVFLAITMISSVACQTKAQEVAEENPSIAAAGPTAGKIIPLSWERAGNPERKRWTEYVTGQIGAKLATFDRARDMDIFCPRYTHLDRTQKINVWSELIAEVAYFESGWDPTNRFLEAGLGKDPVTGVHVYSEGLLQLSYQDAVYRSQECDFNWHKDRGLPSRDPRKSILDPYKNLRCGIGILEEQIGSRRDIVLKSGEYWSTLRSYHSKVPQIAGEIKQRMKFCD